MDTNDPNDPNFQVYKRLQKEIETFTDAKGRKIKTVLIPSPGQIAADDGFIMPASYLIYYIGNSTVVVPTYGSPHDEMAVEAIARLFPTRTTLGLESIAILSGGRSFHCITQQVPTVLS